jgi:hypothetical protein
VTSLTTAIIMSFVTRRRVTHCPADHDLAVHGRVNSRGAQVCTACERRAAREYRARRRMARLRPWVLVTWTAGPGAASFAYFATEADAERAAPHDRPYTVVNGRRQPRRPLPSVEELLRTWTAAKTRAM